MMDAILNCFKALAGAEAVAGEDFLTTWLLPWG
jgi:hypothetical protein